MPDSPAQTDAIELRPLPYHDALRAYLQREEADVWRWYAAHRVRPEQADAVRFELLKATYRLDRESQPEVHAAAESAARRLGLDLPITLYQAHNPAGLNASLAFVPDEAHIVLHGPVAARLTEAELRALLAHELGHLVLWRCADGDHLVVDQILAALTNDPAAEPPHFASARLLRLYSEVFCDRAALRAVDDPLVVVAMLLKVHTELEAVSAESYLQQAAEVFGRGGIRAEELTHPEVCIRTRAVKLFADGDPAAEAEIRRMIEGDPALDRLDLLGQQRVAGLTRRLLDAIFAPAWMRSEPLLAHARLFFEDYAPPPTPVVDAALADDLRTDDVALQEYYCFVLLDFVTADRELEDLPLAAALSLSERLGLRDRFGETVQRELRLRKRLLERIDQEKERLLARAESGVRSLESDDTVS
jgi:hypothetical protein